MKIGLVGPCAAGKSTLKTSLESEGYKVSHIAQEHSFVPDMWKRITNPDILIFLDVAYEDISRRKKIDLTEKDYQTQQQRLRHARSYADYYQMTSGKSITEIRENVLKFLEVLY